MEYPKKFSRVYEDQKPVKIIRGDGSRIVEYRLIREVGKMGVYKR